VLKDEILNPLFGDRSSDHPRYVAATIGEIFGCRRMTAHRKNSTQRSVCLHKPTKRSLQGA
jgi:hypothetical protein